MIDKIIEKLGIFDPNLVSAIAGSEAYRYGGSSSQKGIPNRISK
jgi:hypothetical protein